MGDGIPTESNPFQVAAQEKYVEDLMPRMRQIHEHDRNRTEGGALKLNTLVKGDEVILDFMPESKNLNPEKMTLTVTDVGDTSIKAIASGGPLKWVDKEVGIGHSSFGGSMARVGVLEIGLYPKIHYFDQKLKNREMKLIEKIYGRYGQVNIRGAKFDEQYFKEFRTDLKLKTRKQQIHWLKKWHGLGRSMIRPGILAGFEVNKPENVSLE